MNIRLIPMTQQLMREFFRDFAYDPDTFENESDCTEYVYSHEKADAFYKKHDRPNRRHFAIMLDQSVIGDLYFKHISKECKCCTLSIHLINDSVKNRGYGTATEYLALQYAFQELDMEYVYADALIINERSRHVLQKVGFKEQCRNESSCYYRCSKHDWLGSKNPDKVSELL